MAVTRQASWQKPWKPALFPLEKLTQLLRAYKPSELAFLDRQTSLWKTASKLTWPASWHLARPSLIFRNTNFRWAYLHWRSTAGTFLLACEVFSVCRNNMSEIFGVKPRLHWSQWQNSHSLQWSRNFTLYCFEVRVTNRLLNYSCMHRTKRAWCSCFCCVQNPQRFKNKDNGELLSLTIVKCSFTSNNNVPGDKPKKNRPHHIIFTLS